MSADRNPYFECCEDEDNYLELNLDGLKNTGPFISIYTFCGDREENKISMRYPEAKRLHRILGEWLKEENQ